MIIVCNLDIFIEYEYPSVNLFFYVFQSKGVFFIPFIIKISSSHQPADPHLELITIPLAVYRPVDRKKHH